MSLILWRLCLAGTAKSASEAFSGDGAARAAGRWNPAGRRVVYCAASQSVALLEMLVDIRRDDLPRLSLFRAEVPDDVASEKIAPTALPPAWRSTPAPSALRELGASWLDRRSAALLVVPSAIVPEEPNVLLSPAHPDFARLTLSGPFRFEVDRRIVERLR